MLRRQQATRRRGAASRLSSQYMESIPYVAPSDLLSDFVVSTALRDMAVLCKGESVAAAKHVSVVEERAGSVVDVGVTDGGCSQCDECAICLSRLDDKPASVIEACNHTFHDDCISDWIARGWPEPSCPLCQQILPVEPRGCSPSGTMTIQQSSSSCPGFPSGTTCIKLIYDIPSGTQLPFHDHPGTWYEGTRRTAYLPDTDDGRRLLCRLKYAFAKGHTFNASTSQTTGKQNAVVWSGAVDHKTSLHGGLYGFPDPEYLSLCHSQLDVLGVPGATECCLGLHPSTAFRNNEVVQYVAPHTRMPFDLVQGALVPVSRLLPSGSEFLNGCDEFNSLTPSLLPTVPLCRVPTEMLLNSPTQPPPSAPSQPALDSTSCTDEVCSICFEPVSPEAAAEVIVCNHKFHRTCIVSSLSHNPRCPICRTRVMEPRGRSPSGTMNIKCLNCICPGFGNSKVIELSYIIPSGIQGRYHENPGAPFSGTNRKAYLPNNEGGRHLLTRLEYAWSHGLTFTIGTSLTTRQSNVVTWTSIPHKTSLHRQCSALSAHPNPHSFPDPNYIANCNEALDALGVPDADSCLMFDAY